MYRACTWENYRKAIKEATHFKYKKGQLEQ